MWIGIDTSCYTTSFAAVAGDGSLLAEQRRILQVEMGSRGLAQSAALFQHIREGKTVLCQGVTQALRSGQAVQGVCVSSRPRPSQDSYMPVFLAGVQAAELMAACWQVPVFYTSHQEGHLMAGLKASQMLELPEFLAVHLSGGTSEILWVERQPGGFAVERLGGTLDLHAGQLVDRIGIVLGEQFPCGPALDALALAYHGPVEPVKSFVKGYDFSFSGGEAELLRRWQSLAATPELAEIKGRFSQELFLLLAKTLEKALRNALAQTGLKTVLLVGGVAGSQFLCRRLQHRLEGRCDLYFTPPQYSKDNAYGVALLGLEKFKNQI